MTALASDRPRQRRGTITLLAGAYAATGLFLVAVAALGEVEDLPFSFFSREPASALADGRGCVGEVCSYAGLLSNVGALVWGAGAAVALFAALLLGRRRDQPDVARTLLAAGLLTAVLAVDDLVLFHDYFAPFVLFEHSQSALSAAYFGLTLGLLWLGRTTLERTDLALLAAATALLGASAGLDAVWDAGPYALEDGLKLFGIVTWTAFLLRASITTLERRS